MTKIKHLGEARTIALFGLFGCDNLGNEATLAAVLHGLHKRLPDARLVLVSDAPKPEAALPSIPLQLKHNLLPVSTWINRIRPYRLRVRLEPLIQLLTEPIRASRTRQSAKNIDLFLVAGTGIADDFYQGPFNVPFDLARWTKAVYAVGGQVKMASIGAGPVAHWLSVRWFKQAMQLADYRSYREKSSKDFALRIGLDAVNDPVMPDMVFSLPLTDQQLQRPVQWPPKSIGLGIMNFRGWNTDDDTGNHIYADYMAKTLNLARGLLAAGYHLTLLVGSRGSDRRAFNELRQALLQDSNLQPEQLQAVMPESYLDVLEQISETDLVIAIRFHNVLKALLLQRPVISIEYAQKNGDLMAEMGLSEYCHAASSFDCTKVLAQVASMAELPAPPTERLKVKVAEYRQQLEDQFDKITAKEK